MRHFFTTSQWVPFSSQLVFAFFADPCNLPSLMPRWQSTRVERTRIVPPPDRPAPFPIEPRFRSIAAGVGSTILISFRPFPLSPIRLSWLAAITAFVWNDYFCDEQQSGPFANWKHCHHVQQETRQGVKGTLITDEVDYEMKMGAPGELAHQLFFGRQIGKLFSYRQKQLPKLLARSR